MEENKLPRRKKPQFSLTEVLADPEKAIGKLLDSEEVQAKIADTIAKLPPDALSVLAARLVEYLPAPPSAQLIAAEVIKQMPPVASADESEAIGNIAVKITQNNELVKQQLMELAAAIQRIQDDMPNRVQEYAGSVFQKEYEALQKKARELAAQRQSAAAAANFNQPGAEIPGEERQIAAPGNGFTQARTLIFELVDKIGPMYLDYLKSKNSAGNNTAALLEAYVRGMTKGNALKAGVATAEDAAAEILSLTSGGHKES